MKILTVVFALILLCGSALASALPASSPSELSVVQFTQELPGQTLYLWTAPTWAWLEQVTFSVKDSGWLDWEVLLNGKRLSHQTVLAPGTTLYARELGSSFPPTAITYAYVLWKPVAQPLAATPEVSTLMLFGAGCLSAFLRLRSKRP